MPKVRLKPHSRTKRALRFPPQCHTSYRRGRKEVQVLHKQV